MWTKTSTSFTKVCETFFKNYFHMNAALFYFIYFFIFIYFYFVHP